VITLQPLQLKCYMHSLSPLRTHMHACMYMLRALSTLSSFDYHNEKNGACSAHGRGKECLKIISWKA
jgi:hypothetical protein